MYKHLLLDNFIVILLSLFVEEIAVRIRIEKEQNNLKVGKMKDCEGFYFRLYFICLTKNMDIFIE